MRKTILVLASLGFAMLVASGVVWAATIRCNGGLCNGTPKADTMYGTPKSDAIRGKHGGDTMYGLAQRDFLAGSLGSDRLYGGRERDILRGGEGADKLYGGPSQDSGEGDAGVDRLFGGPGFDTLEGGWQDRWLGDVSDDYIHGGSEADRLFAGSRDDFGDEREPRIPYLDIVQLGVDRFYGEKGDDFIYVAANLNREGPYSKDIVDCGPGTDEVWFDPAVDVIKNCEVKYPFSYPSQ
jgi:Ca2+-binding RTX toxin-like protein